MSLEKNASLGTDADRLYNKSAGTEFVGLRVAVTGEEDDGGEVVSAKLVTLMYGGLVDDERL